MSFFWKMLLAAVLGAMCAKALLGQEIIAEPTYQRDSKIVQSLTGLDDLSYRARWVIRSDDGRLDPETYVHQDESGISIWAGPGKYESICTLAIITEGGEIDWVDLQLDWEVSGEPGPVPDDPEDPVGPQTGFDEVPALVADLVRPVRDADKAENCKALGDIYRKHGALAREGAHKTGDELADACNAEYQYAIGINAFLRYRPAMTLVREAISKMMKDGRMKDMDDWGNLWVAIGTGFEKASKEVTDGSIPNASS